jgi:hypothetical protein
MTAGIALLAVSLANGFLIHTLPLARLALSAHLVGLIGSTFLLALGACWPAVVQAPRTSRIAAFLAVYGFCGGWVVYFSAAATGAGGMFPMASGNTRANAALEGWMSAALLTVALALFALCGILLRGLHRTRKRN